MGGFEYIICCAYLVRIGNGFVELNSSGNWVYGKYATNNGNARTTQAEWHNVILRVSHCLLSVLYHIKSRMTDQLDVR